MRQREIARIVRMIKKIEKEAEGRVRRVEINWDSKSVHGSSYLFFPPEKKKA